MMMMIGKMLQKDQDLCDAGIEEGDMLNCVPKRKPAAAKKTSKGGSNNRAKLPSSSASSSPSLGGGGGNSNNALADLLKGMGNNGMGGGGGGGGGGSSNDLFSGLANIPGMPDMSDPMKAMEQVKEMMDNPIFRDFINDPEKLEMSRQAILANPMMKNMMMGMPGFGEVINDPVQWRETMVAATEMYQNMAKPNSSGESNSFNDINKMINDLTASSAASSPPSNSPSPALDELESDDEDDDEDEEEQ
jgi:hypothetical protein